MIIDWHYKRYLKNPKDQKYHEISIDGIYMINFARMTMTRLSYAMN